MKHHNMSGTGTGLQDGLMFAEAGHRMPRMPILMTLAALAIAILRPFGRGPSGPQNGGTSSAANAQGVVQLDAKRLDPQASSAECMAPGT